MLHGDDLKSRIIRKTRTSRYITIPPAFCRDLEIDEGSFVNMVCIDNKIIVTPVQPDKTKDGEVTSSNNQEVA